MKTQTRIPRVKDTPALRAHLDRVNAIVTAKSIHPRSYSFVNGLGTLYRVEALSACDAVAQFRVEHGVSPSFEQLRVVENGGWTSVI